jgi:hypothetical protein
VHEYSSGKHLGLWLISSRAASTGIAKYTAIASSNITMTRTMLAIEEDLPARAILIQSIDALCPRLRDKNIEIG